LNDLIFGVMLLSFTVIGMAAFIKAYLRRREAKAAVWLLCLIVSAILWSITYALFYLLPTGNLAIFFIDLRYVFVMASGWFVFIFIHRTLSHQPFKRRTLLLLALFPIIDLVLVLANSTTGIFIDYAGYITINGFRALVETDGIGFIYHCILSYAPLALAAADIIVRFIRLPKRHGKMLGWLFFGMVVVFALTLTAVLQLLPYPIDLAPFGVQVMLVMFYNALFNSKSMDMLFISRDIIFDNSSSIILVLDSESSIVDYNKQANEVARRLQIADLIGMRGDEFLESWRSSSQSYVFEEDASIFAIVENEMDYHYQVQVNDMFGKNGHVIGSYMEIKNISPIMSLIHMLQDAAYYDSLTGMPNRNYFVKMIYEIDRPESLPLCVIVGDINGLKLVNDTYGHVKGDLLLKWVSSIMLQCAPHDAILFRMGGDEFVGLLPNTTEERVEGYIKEIDYGLLQVQADDPELATASIALGYKIKTSPYEQIEELMKAADYEMYTTKRNRRSSQR